MVFLSFYHTESLIFSTSIHAFVLPLPCFQTEGDEWVRNEDNETSIRPPSEEAKADGGSKTADDTKNDEQPTTL